MTVQGARRIRNSKYGVVTVEQYGPGLQHLLSHVAPGGNDTVLYTETWTASRLDDDHYDLGTGDNSIFIRKLDLYGLPLPQLHLSYV